MTRLLGIDLGTSSVKAVIIDELGQLCGVGAQEYPIRTAEVGWAEQDPQAWWSAAIFAIRQAMNQAGSEPISGIGLSGQMHGTVLIDARRQPLGPAIIWADQRSTVEVDEITALVGVERLARICGTAPATGFLGPTLLWLKRHDPARLDKAFTCLLPKDYIRLRLTGEMATDASDASATALFDVPARRWSAEIVDTLGLPVRLLPTVLESAAVAGMLIKDAADALGLPVGTPVVAGCADQVAQAIGNGLIDPGVGSVTIGTGGQVFAPLTAPQYDDQLRLHVFCHAPPNRWYLLGAMLSAGLSLRWFRNLLGAEGDPNAYAKLAALAADVPPGAAGLLFLPYLIGERAPLRDPLARGSFVGLTLRHERGHLARAIMEGVAFALRQIVDVMVTLNAPLDQLLASGNGLASPVWRQIVADVLNRPLYLATGSERSGIGAALIAGIGTGRYSDYSDTRKVVGALSKATDPDPRRVRFYTEHYERFLHLYPLLGPEFHDLSTSSICISRKLRA
ncbi:MAG: xylulokinase [Aggregatilineales bacterium]